jgi:putative acetyltransferase
MAGRDLSRLGGGSVEVRSYKPDDLEAVVALWRASKQDAFPYVEAQQRYTLEEDAAYFRHVVAVENEVWIAEVDGRLAGLLAIRGDFIDQIYVAVDRKRSGVGSALLQKARSLSPVGLRLFTFQRNAPARAFYEKHGFVAVRFGINPPPENEPDVEYRWTG